MTVLERQHLKKGMERKVRKMTNLERENMEKGNAGKDKSEKGQLRKVNIRKR